MSTISMELGVTPIVPSIPLDPVLMGERRAMLVAALRSGEYAQAAGSLRLDDGFCCLGVACDLYIKETGLAEWIDNRFIWANDIGVVRSEGSYLPIHVCSWYGFKSRHGSFGLKQLEGPHTGLAHMNDQGISFSDIADVIETKDTLFRDFDEDEDEDEDEGEEV